jgi:hypothetical protein
MPNQPESSDWQWLMDLLAEQLADDPSRSPARILQKLDIAAGYRLTDDLAQLMPREAARRALVDGMLARFSNGRPAFPGLHEKKLFDVVTSA